MNVTFVELPPFEEYRKKYLDDDSFRLLQNELLKFPDKGELIQGTGGLRKLRIADIIRQKGKRGGARGNLLLLCTRETSLVVPCL